MHAVARLAAQRLRGEVGGKTVAQGDGIYDRAERDRVVRGLDRLGIPEIDLILTGALFMVGAFRADAHLFKRQADLAADVLALILGRRCPCTRRGRRGSLVGSPFSSRRKR